MRKRGFTLVELLVVIAIIGILAGMLMPQLGRIREEAYKAKCRNNLRVIGHGITMYLDDFNDRMPVYLEQGMQLGTTDPMKSLSLLYPEYVSARNVFKCPSTNDRIEGLEPGDWFRPQPAIGAQGETGMPGEDVMENRTCSYGYDDTKNVLGVVNASEIAIVADAPVRTEGGAQSNENSANHKGFGQNVLYLDMHVEWETTPYCGLQNDNIYEAQQVPPAVSDSRVVQMIMGGGG